MSNTVDNLQSPFNKSRVDKFIMVLNIPPALKAINSRELTTNNTINLDTLQFSVFGTVVPDIVVPAVEMPHTGSTIYISSHARTAYGAQNVKFTIDNRFNNYWVIHQWLDLMRSQEEGQNDQIVNDRNLASKKLLLSEYSSTLTVFAVDEFNSNIIRFDYFNAFPTKLGGIDWNYQESAEIISSFEFVFSNITLTRL